jgi:hypothetical protein
LPIENTLITLENPSHDDLPIEKGEVVKKGLSARQLAKRLESNHVQIGREWKKGYENFSEWSKSLDPDHKAWTKDPDNDKKYIQLINS